MKKHMVGAVRNSSSSTYDPRADKDRELNLKKVVNQACIDGARLGCLSANNSYFKISKPKAIVSVDSRGKENRRVK